MLLVHAENVGTTYQSTMFKTHVFCIYYLLCIDNAIHLCTVYLDWLQAVSESNSRCTCGWWWSVLRDTHGGYYWVNVEMHLEADIEWTVKCTWRPWSSMWGDALGDQERENLEAIIEQDWRYNWRPLSSECGDALGGNYHGRLDEYLVVVDIRAVNGRCVRSWHSIHWLVNSHLCECDEVTLPLSTNGALAGSSDLGGRHAWSWNGAPESTHNRENKGKRDTLGWMLHSVYAAFVVNSFPWDGERVG